MGKHIVDGRFQSDKYPTCPAGKVPLSIEDPDAQGLLWEYALRHIAKDPEFSTDLWLALVTAGYKPSVFVLSTPTEERLVRERDAALSDVSRYKGQADEAGKLMVQAREERDKLAELIACEDKHCGECLSCHRLLLAQAKASITDLKNNRNWNIGPKPLRDKIAELEEQLARSAAVCPKDGCMLWKDHKEDHATAEQVSAALAAAEDVITGEFADDLLRGLENGASTEEMKRRAETAKRRLASVMRPKVPDFPPITRRCRYCNWAEQACHKPCPQAGDGLHSIVEVTP